jgi:glutamate--cysteine ligase
MQTLIDDPDATLSARILAEMEAADTGFFRFAFEIAKNHRDYFASITQPNKASLEQFRQEAEDSLQRQHEIETADSISLDEYLADYFH